MLPHWTEGYVTVDGRKFHYTRTGDGNKPPLLLLHGFSDNGLCWLRVACDLEDQYDVILPDARGHGLSERLQPDEQLDHPSDVAGIITTLEIQKPIVGEHSMGGSAAAAFGARYPDLASALILEDPAWIDDVPDDGAPRQNPFREWLINIEELSLDKVMAGGKTNNPLWSNYEFPAWAESKHQLDKTILELPFVRQPWRDLVKALTVPTLLITADTAMHAIVSPAVAQEAASLSPFVQIAPVPNAGHSIRRENYPAFMQAVQDFLSQL
jgi:pimeloyl-ACP methyl ester carboxylesterase